MLKSKLINELNLPKNWSLEKLGDLISEAQPGFACGERDEDGVIQLRMNNVDTRGNFVWDEYIRVPSTEDIKSRYRLEKDDVLFNNTNSTELVGKSAIFQNFSEAVVYSNHFTRLRTNRDKLLPEFFVSWLVLNWQKGIFSQICNRWIGQSAVKMDKLLNLEIPLPPISQQKRIVAILNEQMAAIEKARKAAEAQLETVKALKSAYLRDVFNEEKTWNWNKFKLGEICEFVGGMQPPKSQFRFTPQPGYTRLVQIQDFRTDDFSVYIPENEAKRRFEKDDVMIGRYGPPLFQILRGLSGAYNVALMKTIPKENLDKNFLFYLLQEENVQKAVIDQSQRSAGQTGIQKTFLERFEMRIPSIDVQKEIALNLDKKMKIYNDLLLSVQQQINEIQSLSGTVLKEAFKGEL